ncbi:hypothetical protein ABZT27_08985 [Streptomyces sp. NPDC005389]|uniref:hypothetical protein n=1 Tax=Streptomyces sp. NPDC005389 TaxID=3157040 RepID=UPI0033A20027
MPRQRERYGEFYEGDFGLGELTARVSAATGPPPDLPAVLRLAADVAGVCEGEGAVELGNDVRLLRDSKVPDDALREVWLAAVGGRFDPADHGLDMRGWLGRLAGLYPARVRADTGRNAAGFARPEADETLLREDVVAEIRASAAEANGPRTAGARASEEDPVADSRPASDFPPVADSRPVAGPLPASDPRPAADPGPAPGSPQMPDSVPVADPLPSAAPAGASRIAFPRVALESIAAQCDADLALRLCLRVLKVRHIAVGKAQYDRLAALGERLAYPGPLVHDDLVVRWPPVDPARRDAEGDFGLTALASRFAGPWYSHTPGEVLERAVADDEAGQTPGSAAAVLLQDALRLLESPVPTDTITTAWGAASERGYDIEAAGADGRDWLRTVVAACRDHLAEVAPGHRPGALPVRSDLTDDVQDLLTALSPELARRTVSPHARPLPGADAAEAVARVVAEVDPDLGLRLLVRLLAVLAVPLTEERYVRCRTLGERFGYGAWHVSEALELLVRHD